MTRRKLAICGYVILVVVVAFGIFVIGYAGWVAGEIIGFTTFGETINAPAPPGPGLAPNLGPLVEGTALLIGALVLGALSGLALGAVLMGLLCRYVLAPVLAQWPITGTDDQSP